MTEKLFDPCQSSSPLWRLIASDYQGATGLASKCGKCELPGKLRCGGCQEAGYCSKECQRQDWAKHRPRCRPFRIVTSPGVGRHLVATRDIGPGEVILEEAPITGGPRQYTAPVCLGCHAPASLSGPRCAQCQWPVCGPGCEARPLHEVECRIFSEAGIKPTSLKRKNGQAMEPDMEIEHPMYECVTPLRVCLSKLIYPENWKVVQRMETHRDIRNLDENQVHNKHNVVKFLLNHVKIAEHIPDITEEDIFRANDVLDVNAFEIRAPRGGSIRGLYPLTAMMNSSCSPNTQNSIDNRWVCRVRAARAIRKGEEICDTYTSTLCNTLYRRRSLKAAKYFDCACARCADPTELGSHFSSLVCRLPGCQGLVLSTDPLDREATWRCGECGVEMLGGEVIREQEEWEERIEQCPRSLPQQRALLEQLLILYHPHHNMCVDVYFNMVPLIGQNTTGSANENLIAEAEYKLDLVEKVLGVMDKVLPGLFRMRGMFLVEKYSVNLFLLRSKMETKEISKSTFVRRLAGFRKTLEDAALILGFEPEGSLENARLQSVKTFMKQLDQVVADAGKTLIQ